MQENLTQSEMIRLGKKEICKRIREQIKKEFPNLTFSVVQPHYGSISVSLMKANFKVFRDFEGLSQSVVFDYTERLRHSTIEELKAVMAQRHAQLNQYTFIDEFNPDVWNNGHFLTEKAHNIFKRVVEIANQYNYDNSDVQSDYFDVNFYLNLNIGKWDKPLLECV